MSAKDPDKESQWRRIESNWLITNRHVILPQIPIGDKKIEVVPEEFVFNIRKIENHIIKWVPICLTKDELLANALFHIDKENDVAIINITKIIDDKQKELGLHDGNIEEINKYLWSYSSTNDNLPKDNFLKPEVGTDILIASYPKGFYDDFNQFPIVKSGIIASGWGLNFKGQRHFLVDVKLFSGSSGGLVISKPTNHTISNGKVYYNSDKPFLLLGVYSGEYLQKAQTAKLDGMIIQKQDDYGLGIVWYADLIDEIIHNGVPYTT